MALFDLTSTQLLACIFLLCVAFVYIQRYTTEWKIRKLGAVAPIVQTYAPLGLEMPIKASRYFLKNRALEAWLDEFKKAGCVDSRSYTMELRILVDTRVIMTADPENIKAVLTSQFADFGKGYQFHEEWKDFLGDSIFTVDGKQWHDARQLIRPMFMRERVADLDILEKHVQELIALTGPGDGRLVDARNIFFRFTLDASTHFLFGHSAGSLLNETTEFAAAFDEVQKQQALQGRAGPLRHLLPKGSFYKGLKTMDDFIEPWISEALSLSPDELDTKLRKTDSFLHALARHTRDRKMIRDQLTALLLAGRDTTSCTLSWIFLELARNPRVFKKLQAEIEEHVGSSGKPPTYENIKNMKYLTYVIDETLRLYPVVPFNVRTALNDTTLPRGGGLDGNQPIGILKDTAIGFSTLIMQRRRDLYPPISKTFPYDPLEWVPERWETWQPRGHAGWTYIPFNGGPRICIGQQFALIEAAYVVIRLLQQYDRLLDYGNDDVELGISIVLAPHPGVKIGFVKEKVVGR